MPIRKANMKGRRTSTGKSERGISVMSPQDFMEMDDGELVCFIGKTKTDFVSNPWTGGAIPSLETVRESNPA